MKEHWPLEVSEENRAYYFLSRGPRGNINMTIQFTPMEIDGIFNLSFGKLNENGEMDDAFVNNNGDRDKIIATVIAAVNEFTLHYPRKFVYFSGHSEGRNRLYRGVLSIYLTQWLQDYTVWGAKEDGNFELFKKDKTYLEYLIRRKK